MSQSKKSEPSVGIMKNCKGDEQYCSYRISCSCGDPVCDINMVYEVDNETFDAMLSFYSSHQLPIWKRGYNRFRCALKVLFFGKIELESHTLLTKEQALQLSDIITKNFTKQKGKEHGTNQKARKQKS